MPHQESIIFFLFIAGIFLLLMFDLGIFNKKSHVIKFREAIIWTSVWISLGIAFYLFIYFKGDIIHGISSNEDITHKINEYHHSIKMTDDFSTNLKTYRKAISLEYLTGYLIEYALSVDNIFVMILIFLSFGVDPKYYKKVLFWGILGAIVMRFIFIFLSSALIQQFNWILYIFGGLLIITGIRMFIQRNAEEKIETSRHPVVRFSSRYFKIFPRYVNGHFFIFKNKKFLFTPLFLVLLVIEFTDVIFAIDSVPAIFSVTKDPYIIFFSNIFAILGLRSLFFLVSNVMNLFAYLKIGLSVLLVFIGLKMIFHHWLDLIGFSVSHSLYFVLFILLTSILMSVLFPPKNKT
ncbi:MAG TPA: TerC/Alx family metal homeostasis membrane protein [Bacteroidia bacterium]|nr:TerC/Alx family metal homeostasis membrane protein [Bacteroidia bacterium]HRS59557.1 TerC/Alx family metal homeostasis membrane protein [Bacteroidia bacterium]HRU67653.1 TerC/Alx family metal homeostasis membrane protein [Bacteroidia bacterium]